MSQRVVDMVARKFKKRFEIEFGAIQTDNTPLTENAFTNYREVKTYIKQLSKRLETRGLTKLQTSYLVHNYGKQSDFIIETFDQLQDHSPMDAMTMAELEFCLQHEMVLTPIDFYMRRTGRVFFDIQSVFQTKERVLERFSNYFDWNSETRKKHRENLENCLAESTNFV